MYFALLLLLMLPGLALLVFLVIQFLHRGKREIDDSHSYDDDDDGATSV
jgi:hypothetical protein